jgi:hypothetical protein
MLTPPTKTGATVCAKVQFLILVSNVGASIDTVSVLLTVPLGNLGARCSIVV